LSGRIAAIFSGQKINLTENRAVLHVPCAPKGTIIVVDGKNVVPEVHVVLGKMADFSDRVGVASGRPYGKRIKNVINIASRLRLGPVWPMRRSNITVSAAYVPLRVERGWHRFCGGDP